MNSDKAFDKPAGIRVNPEGSILVWSGGQGIEVKLDPEIAVDLGLALFECARNMISAAKTPSLEKNSLASRDLEAMN